MKLKGSESWKWSKSQRSNFVGEKMFLCTSVSLLAKLLMFLSSFAHVWKMMQCHVDACDDMQPPELVSVFELFCKNDFIK